eukprot:343252-Pleurochrysis_carterae.AAC.1
MKTHTAEAHADADADADADANADADGWNGCGPPPLDLSDETLDAKDLSKIVKQRMEVAASPSLLREKLAYDAFK